VSVKERRRGGCSAFNYPEKPRRKSPGEADVLSGIVFGGGGGRGKRGEWPLESPLPLIYGTMRVETRTIFRMKMAARLRAAR